MLPPLQKTHARRIQQSALVDDEDDDGIGLDPSA
jgi:hypothetical protein